MPIHLSYRLRRPAVVSADVRAAGGQVWPLRPEAPRQADEDYQLTFDGTVPIGAAGDRDVLAAGEYELRLIAVEADGRRDQRSAPIRIEGEAAERLGLDGPRLSVETITPDGDGVDDDVTIVYRLSRPAWVEISAESDRGDRASILGRTLRPAGESSIVWDGSAGGRVFGGKRLVDGRYRVEVRATDDAGSVRVRHADLRIANGGIERLEITEVDISPGQIQVGGRLNVRIRVRNTGETTLRTMGPPPNTAYRTDQSFNTLPDPTQNGAPYRPVGGAWRVGLGWQTASQELPLRWGLLPDPDATLPPGATATVEAIVTVVEPPSPGLRFWAGAIREGVGLTTGRVGDRVIEIRP